MKHNFKFLTLSRVLNDCRDSVGRLSTLFFLLFALCFGFTQQAWANFNGGTEVYLCTNNCSDWRAGNERYAICVQNNGSGDQWASMFKVTDNIYKCTIPTGSWSAIFFCRMNGSTSDNKWDNKWNQCQRGDYSTDKKCFYISDNNNNGYWTNWIFCGGNIYFDNTNSNWNYSHLYLVIGRDKYNDDYSSTYEMTHLSNTNLYVVNFPQNGWGDATYMAFGASNNTVDGGNWHSGTLNSKFTKYTGTYTSGITTENKYYMSTPANGNNGCAISPNYIGTSNDAITKYNLSLQVYTNGIVATSSKAKVTLITSYMSAWNAARESDIYFSVGDAGTTKTYENAIMTAKTTLKYEDLATGYQFDGWYDGSSLLSTDNPYTYNASATRTITAKFSAKQTTISLYKNDGSDPQVKIRDITATYDAALDATQFTLPADTSRTGYTWNGFYAGTTSSDTKVIVKANNVLNFFGPKTPTAYTNSSRQWINESAAVNLYANWSAKTYNIILEAGNYPNTTDGTATVKFDGASLLTPTWPTRTGYNIAGTNAFCSDAACTKQVATGNGTLKKGSDYTYSDKDNWNYDATGTVTLYTNWTAKKCTLQLNNMSADIQAGDAQKVVTYDASPIAITAPQKTGKVFAGYFTQDGSTSGEWGVQIIGDDGAFIANVTDYLVGGKWAYSGELTAMTLYAKWNNPQPRKVYFGITDGTNTTDARGSISASYLDGETPVAITSGVTEVPFGKEVTITWENSVYGQYYGSPNKAYTNGKWWNGINTGTSSSLSSSTNNSITLTIAATDISAYVYAKPVLYDITVPEVAHGTASAVPTQAGPHFRSTLTATPADGYDFTAWTISDNTNGKFVDEKTESNATTYVAAKAAITVTPSYTIHNYSITYNGLEDGTHSNPTTYTIETQTITLTDASRIGYDFDGWYSDNGTWEQKITTIELGSHEDVVLYAKWTAKQYTISYKDEGNITYSGENEESLVKTHTYDQETELVAGTKTGYEFQGWFTDSECTQAAGNQIGGKDYAEDFTLYAKWQINTYHITYPDAAAQEAGYFTITDAPATAKYQETVTFKAAPKYGYAGSVVSVTAGGVQLSQEGDTYTFVMGDADVTISVTASSERTCYITASCDNEWGTVTPSGKSGATNMFEEHEYTFEMNPGLTFLKWNIANAKCAPNYTERSYPTIKIIATSEEATISPAIMETYTNVTLNFEPTYMGYIKLNGNNIASGTKTDVSTRTTATIEACTNYGYKFVGWTVTNESVVTLTNPDPRKEGDYDKETNHKMAGVAQGGKTVLTAHFEENTTTEWGIKYGFASDHQLNTNGDFNKRSGETQDKIGYFVANLSPDYLYEFKIYKKNVGDYSNAGTMSWNNCAGWPFGSDQSSNCKIQCGGGGTYVFILDFSSESTPKLTVLYPDQTISGNQKIYFYDYYNGGSILGTPKFRIGNKYYVESRDMVKVPGTTNLYEYQTHGWANYEAFHIASNTGYTGPNQTIYNAGLNSSWIGTAMDHIKLSYSQYIYLEPSGLGDKDSKTNTQYYHQHISNDPNSHSSRIFRRNVVKPTQAEHGTIKVEQWLSDDGSNRQKISDSDNYRVDPSRWITITATAEKGYRTQEISVTTADGTEDYYNGDSWDYVVHKDITKITATYELVKSNTFYVKNHADWITGGHDIWLHYWDATAEPNKKTNWAFPGRMATKMDDTKTWYAVTIENTFFNVNGWKLSQGNEERQTVDYLISSSTWDPAKMDGKYYEIYLDILKDPNEWILKPITENIPTFYRVLVTKGAQTFTSNTVQSTEETLSFFAADGCTVTLQKGTKDGWSDTDISDQFTGKAGVWTAKVVDNGSSVSITTPEAYTGKYYIRTDGAYGRWEDYKVDGNAFTYFTPREGETYSYYWVATVGKANDGTTNVKAKIANEYNNHLSVEIVNDKNTDEYGNIKNASFGSNIRFSYEPTTNAFEREIISGSAGDVFLNVVGENLYSDVSCDEKFRLGETTYTNNPKESKLADISDWVYEKTIYVNIVNNTSSADIALRSLYNNQRTDLYTGTVMKTGTSAGIYKLRATYDFKKNRIITSWSPSSQEITQSMVVDADIQFLQVEKGDVSQISIKATEPLEDAITVSSLDYLLFVLEIEQGGPNYEHYRISLPFDCRISDIYGIGEFDELWGIQMYDGQARATNGWINESTNYWTWLTRDDTLKAGVGYSITVAKNELPFKTIEEEVTRTICNEDGTDCKDITTNESRAALRLYFPSMKKEHSLSRAQNGNENMQVENWACSIPGRTVADANWHFMGSTGYNNIKITGVSEDRPAPNYLYQLNSDESAYEPVSSVVGNFSFRSFKAYMFQYTGTINWAQYTRSQHSDPVSAPRYSATQHAPLRMQIKVMEAEESVAHAYIEMNDNASFGFDQNQDLAWMNSNSTAQVYTKSENEAYAANCIPFESAILPLTVKTLHAGDYTFHLEGANNVAVYLIDYQLQTETLISAGDVAVELEKGSSNERFALRFDAAAAPTDMQNGKGEVITNDGQKTTKLLRNGNIYLINAGRVYNATGAELGK